MRVQWDKETFCPCCGGLCVSAKVYGLCRRLNIPEHTSKSGIFGEFQRDGGDFVWWHSSLPDCKENRRPNEAEINAAFDELLDDIRYAEGRDEMNERNVRFDGQTMDDKLCAIAIARRLHGQVWNSYGDTPQEIKILKPQALYKRVMRHGYEPIAGKDFEVAAAGTFAPSAKPQYNFSDGGDDDDDEPVDDELVDDELVDDEYDAFRDAFDRDKDKEPESCPECGFDRIYCDDAGTNNIGHYGFYRCNGCGHGWTVQFETDGTGIMRGNESVTPPAGDVTHTWRAEVVSEALAEDVLDAEAEAELWAMARAESAAAERRGWVKYDRAFETVRRRGAIERGCLPTSVVYNLAPDIVEIGGVFCQVVGVKVVG